MEEPEKAVPPWPELENDKRPDRARNGCRSKDLHESKISENLEFESILSEFNRKNGSSNYSGRMNCVYEKEPFNGLDE